MRHLVVVLLAAALAATLAPGIDAATKPKAATPAAPRSVLRANAPAATTPAPGQVTPEAESLLAAVARRYRDIKSYRFEGSTQMTLGMGGQNQTIEVPFRLAAVKPAKLRNEILNPMVSVISVSDGSQTWMFVPQSHQYTRQDAAPMAGAGANAAQIGSALAMGTPIQRYLTPIEGLVSARLMGESALDVEGRSVPCTLVEAQYSSPESIKIEMSPNLMWVDTAQHLVLRDSVEARSNAGPGGSSISMRTVTRFNTAQVDQPVPDSLFTFVPPADAQLVDRIGMPGTPPPSSMEGTPARDFMLRDLAGKPQRLSALKGKVVLLDFWATWCGPCRREMPTILKLHRELGPKGLAVVAVNVGETAAKVRPFLKQNGYTFPVWLDAESEVASQYDAHAIPTLVVVDRAGNVSSHVVGVHDEASLREMLKKAGLR